MACCAAAWLLEGDGVVCEVQIRLSCMALAWSSAKSEASCATYLTLQDAVSCFLCALGQVAVCGAVCLSWLAQRLTRRAVGRGRGVEVWKDRVVDLNARSLRHDG
jgi:hypothetical protein